MKLQDKLNEFNKMQIDKFIEVERKHPDNSVTKDDSDFWKHKGNDLTQIKNADGLINQLEYHLVEELCEYFGMKDLAKHFIYMINIDRNRLPEEIRLPSYQAKECIDISNLAFLIWYLKSDNNGK